jgi:hypothetical protein
MIETALSLLVSILSNGITLLAEKKDTEKRQNIQETLAKLKADQLIPDSVIASLKSINIDSKEIEHLQKMLTDDLFAQKLSTLLLEQEDETSALIVEEVKNYCGLHEGDVLAIKPVIEAFALHFRNQMLSNPTSAPFVIIKTIQEDGEKIRSGIETLTRKVEKTEQGIDKIIESLDKQLSTKERGTESSTTVKTEDAIEIIPPGITHDVAELPRTTKMLARQCEDILEKLNRFFKSRAEEVRSIQKKRDYHKAIEMYDSLLSEAGCEIDEQNLLGIYIDCALCCINLDEFNEANLWLCKAESQNADNKKVTALRALFYYETGNIIKAKEYVDRSLQQDRFYHISTMLKTAMELQEGLSGKDIVKYRYLDEAGNLKTGYIPEHHAVIYRTVGQCFLKDKEFDEAIKYFQISNSLDTGDDYTFALLGHAYLEKVVSQNPLITFEKKLVGENKVAIETAVECFKQALNLAVQYLSVKNHTPTYANLSMCYMLLGSYDRAYDIPNVAVLNRANSEILLKAKATAAFYSQRYDEAYQLLSETQDTSCRDVINKALTLLQDTPDLALKLLENALNEKQFTQTELDELRFLKYEILLHKTDRVSALNELRILDKSSLALWEKQVAWGRYSATVGDHDKVAEYFQTAIDSGQVPTGVRINIANYYFIQNNYEKCVELCSELPIEEMNIKSDLFEQLLRISIVSLFNTGRLSECRKLIDYAKNVGASEKYLYEISASLHWQNDELEAALNELEIELGMQGQNRDIYTLCNIGMAYFLLGNFPLAEKYYSEAEPLDGFYSKSNLVIDSIRTLTVIGNTIKAKEVLEKAINLQFENKNDDIHKFAPVFYLRESSAAQFVKYAQAFNQKHGDVEWLWMKNIERDKEELKTLFDQNLRKSTALKKTYLKQPSAPFPLAFMATLGARSEIVHLWSFNREYGLPIFLETGNTKQLEFEVNSLKKVKSVMIDYTCLLALVDAGEKYLWLLDGCFNEILVYRPIYLQILNELMSEEHENLRSILRFLSLSSKVRFLKGRAPKTLEKHVPLPFRSTTETYTGLFQEAKKTGSMLIAGESRIRTLANTSTIVSCGIRALLEHALNKGLLDSDGISEAIIKFAQKDCQFISFNSYILRWLFNSRPFDQAKMIFKMLSSHILLNNAMVDSFLNTYSQFFAESITRDKPNIVSYFLKETIGGVKKLIVRTRIFNEYPLMANGATSLNLNNLNRACLSYIYHLILTVYLADIDKSIKNQYLSLIKTEANLEYWLNIVVQNQSMINHMFSKAENKAKELKNQAQNTRKNKNSKKKRERRKQPKNN